MDCLLKLSGSHIYSFYSSVCLTASINSLTSPTSSPSLFGIHSYFLILIIHNQTNKLHAHTTNNAPNDKTLRNNPPPQQHPLLPLPPSYNTYYTKPLYHTHLLTLYILLGLSTCIHFSTKTLLWLNFLTLGILILTNLQMDE